jgi:hypothetical protein
MLLSRLDSQGSAQTSRAGQPLGRPPSRASVTLRAFRPRSALTRAKVLAMRAGVIDIEASNAAVDRVVRPWRPPAMAVLSEMDG